MNPSLLREKAIHQIQNNEQLKTSIHALAGKKENALRTEKDGDLVFDSVEKYIQEMQKDKTWGTQIELIALARALRKPIVVLTPGNQYDFVINEAGFDKTAPVFLNYVNRNHYAPLLRSGEDSSSDILKRIEAAIDERKEQRENSKSEADTGNHDSTYSFTFM